MTPSDDSNWNSLQWRRRLERFGEDDGPVVAAGPRGEVDGIWSVVFIDFCHGADSCTVNWANSQTRAARLHLSWAEGCAISMSNS